MVVCSVGKSLFIPRQLSMTNELPFLGWDDAFCEVTTGALLFTYCPTQSTPCFYELTSIMVCPITANDKIEFESSSSEFWAGTSYSRSRNVSRHVHILFYSDESTSDYLSCAYKSV